MERLLKAQTHNAVQAPQQYKQTLNVSNHRSDDVHKADLEQKEQQEDQTHDAVQPQHKYLETLDVHDYRSDVHKADLLEQKERQGAVKVDFEQLYWEAISEGSQVNNLSLLFSATLLTLHSLRNLSSLFPYKKLRRLLFPRRKLGRRKRMPNSCIAYQTPSSSRLLPIRF